MTSAAISQQRTVSGNVIDNIGSSLSGATVSEKGINKSTATKEDGSFSLNVSGSGARLVISYIGYVTTEVAINNEAYFTIILIPAITNLDEVVVIGYGTANKKDLTGAIGSVSEKDFNKGIFTSPDQLIQGKVSGVQITSNDGSPGGAATIKIRGNSALTGTGQPLYVVDGSPLDGRSLQADDNPLNFINPIDIESIDVLKDASATAIYGARAAYGVVIINTRKGQVGPAKLDVAGFLGVSSVLKKIDVLNAAQYRDAIEYYGVGNFYDKGGNVDGMDGILRNALQQNYSIAGNGGNENSKYRFSIGYLNQDGIVINTGFKKYSADVSANLKYLDSKKLGMDFHLNASQYLHDGSFLTSGNDGVIGTALSWNPTDSLRNADGSIKLTQGGNINPIALSEFVRDNLKVTTILGSVSPYYKFSDWLEYKLLVSINYSSGISRFSINQAMNIYPSWPPGGLASIKNYELTTEQITQTLSVNKEIFQGLHLDAVAGYEYMKFTSQGFSLSGVGGRSGFGNYGLDYTNYVQFSDANSRRIASYIDPLSELQSFFGRTIFNYNDRYLLTATLRADGSTKFGANNKYGYFPSFAAGWNINKEQFFKIKWVKRIPY